MRTLIDIKLIISDIAPGSYVFDQFNPHGFGTLMEMACFNESNIWQV